MSSWVQVRLSCDIFYSMTSSPSSITSLGTLGVLDREEVEVFSYFLKVKSLAELETRRKIKCLKTDGGKEYFLGHFTNYLQKGGIRCEFSCRYMLEQNDVAERMNRTIEEAVRAMLEEKGMPHIYSQT